MKRYSILAFCMLLVMVLSLGIGGCNLSRPQSESVEVSPNDESVIPDEPQSDDVASAQSQADSEVEESVALDPETEEKKRIGQFVDCFIGSRLEEIAYLPETDGYLTERVLSWAYEYVGKTDEQALVKADTQIEGSTTGYQDPPNEDGSRSGVLGGTWYTSSIETSVLEEAVSRMLGFDITLDGYHGSEFWESQGRMYSVMNVYPDSDVHFVRVTAQEELDDNRMQVSFNRYSCYPKEGAVSSVDDAWYLLDDDGIVAAMEEQLERTSVSSREGTAVIQLHDGDESDFTLVSLVTDRSADRIEDSETHREYANNPEEDERWSGVATVGETIVTDAFVIELPDFWTGEVDWDVTNGRYISIYLKGMDRSQSLITVSQTALNATEEMGDIGSYYIQILRNKQSRGTCNETNWGFVGPRSSTQSDGSSAEEREQYDSILRLMTAGTLGVDDRDESFVNTYLENDFAKWWFRTHIELTEQETTVVPVR